MRRLAHLAADRSQWFATTCRWSTFYLRYGADLNLKSEWWAGGFGLLEHGCTPEQAAPLIARGAIVDIFAAAHLGVPRI